MQIGSSCSGPCETCKAHYRGGCIAGHGDDHYKFASPQWIEEYKAKRKRIADYGKKKQNPEYVKKLCSWDSIPDWKG